MSQALPKRLIEVDLPIKRISAHARREKSIRHGHISTLHIWWARRPLAACRAVTCAALWPDPVDENCPAEFRAIAADFMFKWARDNAARGSEESAPTWTTIRQHTSAYALFNHPTTLRQALLDFIADFANWDNSTVVEYLETARALTAASHWALNLSLSRQKRENSWPMFDRWNETIESLKLEASSNPLPLVVDPFAGGGSIPLEALRIGADAFGSDLNPIPVLLNKVNLEYVPALGSALANEVSKWGEWVRNEAQKRLQSLYPSSASTRSLIACIWARSIISEGPSEDNIPIEVPLLSSFWLSKKPKRGRALRWKRATDGKVLSELHDITYSNGKTLRVRRPLLEVFEPTATKEVEVPPAKRGSCTCPITGYTTPATSVRIQLSARKGGALDARLVCIVETDSDSRGRQYRAPQLADLEAYTRARDLVLQISGDPKTNDRIPSEPLPVMSGVFNAPIYGHNTWGSLYNYRQAYSLIVFGDLIDEAAQRARLEAPDGSLWRAIKTILAMNLSKIADYGSSLATWSSPASQETVRNTFGRQALPMVWDYAEANPLAASSGGWSHSLKYVCLALEHGAMSKLRGGHSEIASATAHPLPNDSCALVLTDPPYYNAVPYADLSDFFYVWLKRHLREIHPSIFGTQLSPKKDECCEMAGWDPIRYPEKNGAWFEKKMYDAMVESRRILSPTGISTVVFAHKTTTGWEAQLQAILNAGWVITGSWPIDTERAGRMRANGAAALASSIHIVMRPRSSSGDSSLSDIGDWRDVLQELPGRIHDWMPRLAAEGVVGADAIFACLGPALEIFSRYSRVEKASGEQVTLREYLEHIWAAVSKEALSSLITDTDLSSLEADARITAMWLWTLTGGQASGEDTEAESDGAVEDEEEGGGKASAKGGFGLEYDAARKIAQGLGASLEDMKAVVEVKGDQARLLPVAERTAYLFGKDQASTPDQTQRGKKKKAAQMDLFAELTGAEATEAESVWEEKTVSKPGATVLDRVHQSMILFATGRGEALKRFLVEDGIGREGNFWKLAQALSALYPSGSQEKRWVDGVLARKKGLGL